MYVENHHVNVLTKGNIVLKNKKCYHKIIIYMEKYRLMAMCDSRTKPYADISESKIWHICLEHYDKEMNYGIYANGLLVESCCERNI